MTEMPRYRLDILEIESPVDMERLNGVIQERGAEVTRWTTIGPDRTSGWEPRHGATWGPPGEERPMGAVHTMEILEGIAPGCLGRPGLSVQAAVRNPLNPGTGRSGHNPEVIPLVRRAHEADIRPLVVEREMDEDHAAVMVEQEHVHQRMISPGR